MSKTIVRLGLVALCLPLAACEKKAETSKVPAAQTAPPAAAAASQPAGAGSQPANPHGAMPSTPPGAPVSGLLKLGEGLGEGDVADTDVLFIMARESQGGGRAGRLVAVKRMGKVKFPHRYELSSKDVMVPGIPFAGPFIVNARIDKDGDPMTKGEADLYAVFTSEVKAGQEGVHLVFKKGRPKPMAAPPGVKAPPAARGAASQPAGAASQPR